MSLVNKIKVRLRRDFFRWKFARTSRQVLTTAPLQPGCLPFVLLSMVQKCDVQSYLLAVKSFACHANPERIVIVCDPSLNDLDRALLSQHVPHAEFYSAETFTHASVPRGGTWERLFAISGFVRDNYVVQLDADTLTLQPIPEVLNAIEEGHGFVLGENADTCLLPLTVTHENALPFLGPNEHIQDISEASIVTLGLPDEARYVRGCSGFTGFPRSHEMRDRMIDFSQRMGEKLGTKWARWGTEQVTSNYLVANASQTVVLPFPKYGTPDSATADTAFFHFIGSMRHVNNQYTAATRQALRLIFKEAA